MKAAFTVDLCGRYAFPLPATIQVIPVRGVWARSFGQATLSAVGRRLTVLPALNTHWDWIQNGLSWRASHRYNRTFQKRVTRWLTDVVADIDVVYVHSNPFLASDVARLRPTVLRLPGPLTAEVLPVLQSVHAVCANGDALVKIRGFLGGDAIELPVGIDHQLFAPGAPLSRAQLGWTSEHRVIGYVGRLSRIKGVDILARAFQLLLTRMPNARLVIVGSGEEQQNLRSLIESEVARGIVHFAGDQPHDDLPRWYRTMDVLAMPSRYENFSNAILEALACGVPFIGSNVGGNRLLFDAGAGWLYEPNTPDALAQTLIEALVDGPALRSHGEQGRLHVTGRYSWIATARRLEEIFSQVRSH